MLGVPFRRARNNNNNNDNNPTPFRHARSTDEIELGFLSSKAVEAELQRQQAE